MSAPGPSLYLAGPEVFLPDAAAVGRAKVALCAARGFVGLFPLEETTGTAADASQAIYAANLDRIAAADGAIFNLTAFRGPSADAGTIFELGVFVGLGKPVFAYANDAEDLLARTRTSMRCLFDGALWRDPAGMVVEDFGGADNLMIVEALRRQGRAFHRRAVHGIGRFRDLSGFQACLAEAAEAFAGRLSA